MTWGVNQVQVVDLTVLCLVLQRCGLRLDGDAALFLDVHRVQHLGFHLAVGQSATALDQTVCQRGFAMVNVGNDGKISDVIHQGDSVNGLTGQGDTRKKGASAGDAP